MRRSVLIIGPFPPPMTGMALGMRRMYEDLKDRALIRSVNISPTSLRKGPTYHFAKMCRILRAVSSIIIQHRCTSTLYMPCDAGWGGIYTVLLLVCGRLMGYKIFLHHRSYAYLDSPTRLVSTVVWAAGVRATHIVLCVNMRNALRLHYGRDLKAFILNNMYRTSLSNRCQKTARIFTLGLLSNLGPEKGLVDFIALMKRLIVEKRLVHGILAGPAWHAQDETTIKKAVDALGKNLEWRGSVQDVQKEQFYRDIDVLVFPTHYRDEAQPNVVFEAMAHGIPVITFARGCIASDVAASGLVIKRNASFQNEAIAQIDQWLDNPGLYLKISKKALVRSRKLHQDSCQQQRMLMDLICNS
jgi:glycosyltransferase involved in cell wall biosynthesis